MFGLSSQSDYALVLLSFLAQLASPEPVPLRSIAASQGLPVKYLSRIAARLTKAGLIGAKEGVRGGVYLVKNPAEITLGEVITLFEGQPSLTKCTHAPGTCRAETVCTVKDSWFGLQKELLAFLGRKTVADLINEEGETYFRKSQPATIVSV